MNWEIGIDIYTLICIKWITNKNLLYKKINKILKLKKKRVLDAGILVLFIQKCLDLRGSGVMVIFLGSSCFHCFSPKVFFIYLTNKSLLHKKINRIPKKLKIIF